jgi:glycosyltransferase involved in cell wall biosynthesis
MKRVLCLFDYIASTGFGTVSNNILKELKKHFGDNLYFDVIAVNYFGESFYQDKNTYVMSGKLNDDNQDDFGRYFFLKKLKENNYDGVFIIQDLGIITPILELIDYINKEKKENKIKQFKTIYYFPVDCEMIPELCKNLEVCDLIVTYNEYGRNIVLKHRPELKGKIKVIPHGNNSKNFYPLLEEDIKKFRQEYFGENADKFIITNVNRNQPRKDFPNTIFGFIEAKENWKEYNQSLELPQPFLYLHCHPKDPMGWDLRILLKQTELEEDKDFKLLPRELENNLADIETLNKIYNASDCFLTTTLGEGWGLSFSEAASCRIPIVAPYSTSFIEMSNYGKNAWMLDVFRFANMDNFIRWQTDQYEIGEKIFEVYKAKMTDSVEYRTKIQKSFEWAKSLEWNIVCKKWIEYFKIF